MGHLGRCLSVGAVSDLAPMRAIWKGAVSFGLVSVPVKLYAATESHDVSFRQVHAKDGGRIKYQRVCSIDGEEVPYSDIAKGYETEDGEMVILDDDDFADLPSTSSREIAVEKFVPRDQIDPMLVREVLLPRAREERRQALRPAAPGPARRRPDGRGDRRDPQPHVDGGAAGARRRDRAADDDVARRGARRPTSTSRPATSSPPRSRWPTCWSRRWPATSTPSEFEDDYADAVEALVKAKIEGGEVKKTPTSTKSSGEVVDLLAALQRSVDAAKTARGEDADDETRRSPPRRPRRRRPPRRPRRRRPASGRLSRPLPRCEVRSRRSRLRACGHSARDRWSWRCGVSCRAGRGWRVGFGRVVRRGRRG